jgi:hypothetical protein
VSKDDAGLLIVGAALWLATIVFLLMGIWMPSWQWAATAGLTFIVGGLLLGAAAA